MLLDNILCLAKYETLAKQLSTLEKMPGINIKFTGVRNKILLELHIKNSVKQERLNI